jgi:hypothetical protein
MFRPSALRATRLLLLLPLLACDGDGGGTTTPPEPEPVLTLTGITGRFEPPAGFDLPVTAFTVSSLAATAAVAADSSFTLDVPVGDNLQVLFIATAAGADPVFLALVDPATRGVSADLAACAQALALNNPLLLFATAADKREYLVAVAASASYATLLTALTGLYADDPLTALDYELHPQVYQFLTQAMVEGIESLAGGGARVIAGPSLEDRAGAEIAIINPTQVFYGAAVVNLGTTNRTVHTVVPVRPTAVESWGWPPVYADGTTQTAIALGAGSFDIYCSRGLDYTRAEDWADPAGRATLLNTGQGLMELVALFLGTRPYTAPADYAGVADHLTLSQAEITRLQVAAANHDVEAYIGELAGLIQTHRTELDEWFWGMEAPASVAAYLRTLGGLLADQTQVFQILGRGRVVTPFFFDLLNTADQIGFAVTQDAGGVLSQTGLNRPPTAAFSISPAAGIVGTEFTFDGSTSTDDNDPPSALEFRWDYESDGDWDTDWSGSNFLGVFSYGVGGAYQATLQVRDSEGIVGERVRSVNVGGGAGTATHVKFFKNVDAWGTNRIIPALQGMGFTAGEGPDTYEVLSSAAMATVTLVPGEDLVILHNDQDQTFYNDYAAHQVKFASFVHRGGAMFWEACDQGWNMGVMAAAGIILPGNVTPVFHFANYNYVPNSQLPLVAGLPVTMAGGFASHEGFANLPNNTTIYTLDDNAPQAPTLIEFNLGQGWVIMTGQPLEFYEPTPPGIGTLLPRILGYFTGHFTPGARAAQPPALVPGASSARHP